MLNSILLGAIVVLLTICIALIFGVKRKMSTDLTEAIKYHTNISVDAIMRQRDEELAKSYAEEKRILDKIELYLEQGNFDLIDYADKITQRVIILATEKAEFALKGAENDLENVEKTISKVQNDLNDDLKYGRIASVESKKNIIKELNRQKDFIEQRVDEAQARLENLTDAILSQTSHDQPML